MKANSRILKIESPCSQNWASMQTNANGKYCLQCSKNVLDFTKLSDKEILQVIQKQPGKTCGRFDTTQLNRILTVHSDRTVGPWANKWLAGILMLLSIKHTNASGSFHKESKISVFDQSKTRHPLPVGNPSDSLKNIFSGTIVDVQTKEVLVFATVRIKNTNTGVTTNIDGKFTLKVPPGSLTDSLVLEISYIGYYTKFYTVQKNKLHTENEALNFPAVELRMKPDQMIGEIIIVKKKKWWQRKPHRA
jgi:hypothetical protein